MAMRERKGMLAEFREFVMRRNVLELAVAIILGIAFGAVVLALVDGIIMPLIAAIFGDPNFDALVATVGDGEIRYGTFITAVVNFILIAAALFLIIKGVQRMSRPDVIELDEKPSQETLLLTEIRDLLAERQLR